MNMDTSDSSDDEKNSVGLKTSKLKIADVAENDEHSSPEEKEKETNEAVKPAVKKIRKKKTTSTKRKQVRPKTTTNSNPRPRQRPAITGLNGNYWNVVQYDRHANTTMFDHSQLVNDDDDDDDTTSVSEQAANEKLRTLLTSTSSSSSTDLRTLLYSNRTFITCRSPSDSFFLCQVLQDVYNDTKKFRIRWCSRVDGADDEAEITENTHFKIDYDDTLDPHTILTGIHDVIHHSDKTISLKKQDIIETKRLLEKSVKGETPSSDEPMDLTTDKIPSDSSDDDHDDSLAIRQTPPKIKKRKIPLQNTRKQPPKKRARKTSGETTGNRLAKLKRQLTKDINEISDGEKETAKPKRTPKTAAPKPVTTPKAQLFKVQSNRLLKENSLITTYRNDPFFEDNLPVPYISSFIQGKLAIRAVLINDPVLLKSLIADVDRVCSVHVKRGLQNDLTAIHYAIKNDNIEMLKILLEDLKTPENDRCPFPTVAMTTQSTGRSNIRTFGFRSAQIMAARGAKEGNNALNKDDMNPLSIHSNRKLILYALKNNCSREVYDLFVETNIHLNHQIYENIFHIVRSGYRKLAASIIGDIKDNTFYGFNNLHHQVLLFDNEDLTINRATSVVKKTKDNFHLTPIHCAAINPNSKYLKQLLNIMPEYNILDKYERRPIHFAAACEGPEPLEYLLSKHVNFNDVDRGGNSPLHIAVMNGRAINAEILLRTAHEKAESNDAEDQIVHQKFGLASINRLNKNQFYPLHLAVLNNHLNCVKVLLEYGANVDVLTSNSSGKLTPLMLACQKGYFKIISHLIENGAKVEARDRFKRTPLIHACMCGNAHIVSYLLRLGANAKVFDSSLNTALHYAIAYGWYFCVKLLIEAGANVNCVNSWQTTCLAAGFLKGHYGLCDYLLTEHHVDINFKTDDGLTLVMLTVGLEISSSSVQQLDYIAIKHKADCTSVDANGNNAFHYLANNTSEQESTSMSDDEKNILHKNLFQIAQILFDNQCNPNQMNNKAQSPLMIALESGNYIFVDYLINKAKVEITADISHDGKNLLHYFAIKCEESDLIQTLIKLPINKEIKKMGQMFDNNGRTPFHYCTEKFDQFCEEHKTSHGTDQLKKQYQSIIQIIEYCLRSVECDPDVEIQLDNQLTTSEIIEDEDDDDSDEVVEKQSNKKNIILDEETTLKPKQTSIFSLLRTVPFADKHPLEIFLKKSPNLNVLHHQTHRTPLLQAIYLQEYQTTHMLINESSCDINLSTSILSNECQQTPLILACKLQILSIIKDLLNHKECNILSYDYQHNQAIHYYLSTSNRSIEYFDILNIFIEKIKLIHHLNIPGQFQRTPLHIAIYHNSGTIDSTTDVEEFLIDNGSDLFLKDQLGNIPLHNMFLKKTIGDDPVELCVVILKAMKNKRIDTENNEGNTPLHIAVMKCSTVCVTLLQQHSASLGIENKLGNSIIGTCIASNHLNLFITFIQQSIDMDLGKLHTLRTKDSSTISTEEVPQNSNVVFRLKSRGPRIKRTGLFSKTATPSRKKLAVANLPHSTSKKISVKENTDIWEWKYINPKPDKEYSQHSLIYLIIERDWQGALSLILNELERFHLNYIQILEAAILNNKLNLVHRLLLRLKDKNILHSKNSHRQNLFHLLANLTEYDQNLFEQILLYLHEYHLDWNSQDKYGSYPIHYACVKHNFSLIHFFQEKYSIEFNINQLDSFENTPIGLLFWRIASKTSFSNEQIRLLISSNKQLDYLCNYDNEIAMNPLSFGYIEPLIEKIFYPPMKSDTAATNVRTSPLINAIVYNNFLLAKFLLELGADVNYSDEEKRTPLMHAVRQNNIDIVKLLLNKDYSPKENDEISDIFRHQSQRTGPRPEFFLGATTTSAITTNEISDNLSKSDEFLVTSSIDLNASDSLGRTCIHHLVQPFPDGSYTSNIELLRLLHKSGASLIKHDLAGLSPLQYGAINGCQHLCDELTKLINDQTDSTQPATIERFYINDPNKNLLNTSPDFYSDAQELIDQYISLHPSRIENAAYQVDRLSGMSLTGEVVIDNEKNEPYDVRLTKTDVSYGIYGLYNFYRMQIIKHQSKNNLYFLFTRWGRIGDDGQHQLTPYSTLDECRKEFVKVFREKTGNAWKDTDQFETKIKKYTLIQLNEREMQKYSNVEIDFNRLQSEQQSPSSKLQSIVYKNFLKTFINHQAIRTNITKTQLDVEWMPVSQLRRERLQKARDLLIKLKKIFERKQELTLEIRKGKTIELQNEMKTILESIYQYTNEYYTIIPLKGYSNEKLPIIDNEILLKNQEKILDDLLELELAYKILLGAQANLKTISPLDYLYKSINCQFEAMNKDDIDSQFILRYIWASSANIRVEQVFKIARPNEDEILFTSNLDNHYLLWHGTSICNLISILTRGLLVGPLAATATGSLFGKGIYTADAFDKSLSYCSGVKQNDGERCFMILCEVALGKIKQVGLMNDDDGDDDDDTKQLDLKKFQSRKAVGQNVPDPRYTITRNYGVRMPLGKIIPNPEPMNHGYGLSYNEYIVYDESQVAIRYLVQFRR